MEWSNYIYPIFIVHNSLYSVLVNSIRDACFYGYTALPNCFYLVNTSKEPVCPRVELILKIIIILLIIFLGFIKSKPC